MIIFMYETQEWWQPRTRSYKQSKLGSKVEDIRLKWAGGQGPDSGTVDKLRKAHGKALINKAKSYTGGGRKAPSPMGHYDLLKRKLVKKHQKKQTQVG